MSPSPSTGNHPSFPQRLGILARDIKLSHSVFALPFALLATFLATGSRGRRPDALTLGLILLCMVLARTVAMVVNRLADAQLDAHNPRTAGRALPSGRLPRRFAVGIVVLCSAGFILASAGFWWAHGNPWPVLLAPAALLWLALYSYTKRFTWLCHLWLGSSLALAPAAAVLAVEPSYLARPEPYLLAGMVLCWVAGFDIIYAIQDLDVDRAHGLFSMPAKLGVEPALWISRALHGASVALLVVILAQSPLLGAGFLAGIILMSLLLVLEHVLVWRSGTHHIDLAFFTLNGIISLALGALGLWDVLRRG